jgi:protein KRI1
LEFRYRSVEPNAFGLSTEEILNLDDRQLNAWVSTKKVTGYRTQQAEQIDRAVYGRKGRDAQLKRKVFSSM